MMQRLRPVFAIAHQVRHIRPSLLLHKKATRDACSVFLVAVIVYFLTDWSEVADKIFRFVADHPEYEVTDIFALVLALGAGSVWFSARRFRDLRHEVAARQQAEQDAKDAASLLEDAVESISEGFVIFDRDDRLVMCNQRYRDFYRNNPDHIKPGITFEELLRLSLAHITHEHATTDKAEWLAQRLKEHRAAKGSSKQRLADGSWIFITERRMRNGGTAGLRIDITNLQESQAALRRSEERLDLAQEIAGIGSWELDTSTNRYTWSKQMYRVRGLSPDAFEPTTATVAAHVHPDDEPSIRQFGDDLRAGIARNPMEKRFIGPDGEVRVLRYEGRPIADRGGTIRRVIGTAQDVTDRRLMERRLAEAQKMEAIGQFAGGMAHDFNNDLGIVIGNLEILEDFTGNDPAAEELRAEALAGALHGAELTRQLLAFARRQPLHPTQVQPNQLILSISKLLARLLGEHIELRLELTPEKWSVSVDPTQLEAALANLVSNGRDAMGNRGVLTITTSNVCVDGRVGGDNPGLSTGDHVLIEVTDTGTGIPAHIVGNVFDPFFTTKPQGKGTGLGLSTVFGFVRQSGGHVSVRSQSGLGTTFSLYLRRCADGVAALPDSGPQPMHVARTDPQESVLIVEDNALLRRSTVRSLVELGYRAFEAKDADAAITILNVNESVTLLFSDVIMPGSMDGFDLVERVRLLRPGLRCLLTSGFADLAGREHRLDALECELLSKPYRREELATAVRHAIDGSALNSAPH